MSYYFGPHIIKESAGTTAETVVVARTSRDNPDNDLRPVMRYAYGPYRTKTEALEKAHYQFTFIRRFLFVNCCKPTDNRYD
jgi:hypothetical protein